MGEKAIDARGLTRQFGDFKAVSDVTFTVERGEIFGYLGSNGAGKSTSIRMLTALLPPSSGTAMVAGHEVTEEPRRVKQSIGYMSQKFSLYMDLTVEENLEFFAGAYELSGRRRRRRVAAAIELAGLDGEQSRLTGSLPGGIRQRLALASALLHEPEMIFLDEPTAGVDPASRREFWRVIRLLAREGTTVFVTTHHLDEAEYCHRIGLMDAGELVALDTPAELKREYIPETVFEVDTDSRQAAGRLAELEEVTEVQPFGNQLHVFVRGELEDPARFESCLAELSDQQPALSGVRAQVIEPTLEDVFLRVMSEQGGEER